MKSLYALIPTTLIFSFVSFYTDQMPIKVGVHSHLFSFALLEGFIQVQFRTLQISSNYVNKFILFKFFYVRVISEVIIK